MSMKTIYEQTFPVVLPDVEECRVFIITDDVVMRAIDLVSGQLQQLNLLLDDSNAPLWSANVSPSIVVVPLNPDQSSHQMESFKKKNTKKMNAGVIVAC